MIAKGGAYFGELATLDGEPRSTNIVALEETLPPSFAEGFTICCTLFAIRGAHPKEPYEDHANFDRRIIDLTTVGSNKRLHAEFLRLAMPGMKVENAGEISPIPIHGDIAVRVSTTRETVARVFTDLTREGIL